MKILLIIIAFCSIFGLSLTLMIFYAIEFLNKLNNFEIEITEEDIINNLRL